jgi:hypothetical protein
MKLTEKNVVSASPGRHSVGDGLYLYVSPDKQTRRWIHRYSRPGGRGVTEAGLGPWPVVSLEEARTSVLNRRRLIRQGVDPVQAKRQERQASITFKEAIDKFLAQNTWAPNHIRNIKHMLLVHGEPLHDAPVSQITPELVRAALAPIAHMEIGRRTLVPAFTEP